MPYPDVILTREAFGEVIEAYSRFDEYVIDVETKGQHRLNPKTNEIFWVGLAGPGRADVIPCGHPVGEMIAPAGKERRKNPATDRLKTYDVPARFSRPPKQLWVSEVFEGLRPLLFSDRRVIGHNIAFDLLSISKYYGGELPPPPYGDTGLLARIVEENHKTLRGFKSPYALDACVFREYGLHYEKIGKNLDEHPFGVSASYVRFDARFEWLLWNRYQRQLDYEQQRFIWEDVEQHVFNAVLKMEAEGVPVSRRRLKEVGEEFDLELARTKVKLDRAWEKGRSEDYPEEFNPNADRQVAHLIYDIRKHRCLEVTAKKGERRVNKDNIERYNRDPVVAAFLRWNEIDRLRSFITTLDTALTPEGRVHTQFNQLGTVTARFSSSGWMSGLNLQQIPVRTEDGRKVRSCFVAPKGYVLLIADFSQIELRVLAHYTQDPVLLRAYREGLDLHAITARAAYHIPEDVEIPAAHRARAKNVNFSIVYGAGPMTLVIRYGVPTLREAKMLRETFYKTYRRVKPWIYASIREARSRYQKGDETHVYQPPYVTTVLGRRRRIPQLLWGDPDIRAAAERQAINSKIQGSAADLNKLALVEVDRAVSAAGLGARMVLNVHDELVALVPEDEGEETLSLVTKAMEGVVHPVTGRPLLRVPVKVDAKLADNWSEKG